MSAKSKTDQSARPRRQPIGYEPVGYEVARPEARGDAPAPERASTPPRPIVSWPPRAEAPPSPVRRAAETLESSPRVPRRPSPASTVPSDVPGAPTPSPSASPAPKSAAPARRSFFSKNPPAPPTGPLRVALDVRMIGASGIGSYLAGLLEGMAEIGVPIEWTFIGPRVPVPAGLRVREWIEFDAPIYGRREFFSYPSPRDIDLLHFPHYNLPLVRAPKKLVTFHDAFHVKYGTLPKRVYQRLFLKKLRHGRAEAIAVSGKSAEDLVSIGRVHPDRIHVVPLGPGRSLPDARRRIEARPLATSTGRTLAPEWLLAVGIDQPHKNMDFLLSAYAMWRLRRDDTIPLVWVGAAAERIPELLARIPAYAREGIHLEPYQDAARVEELYAGARALVFPSLDEGFGLPPLEAMTRGIPVLCSRRRPMTDLLGDGPIWFDPDDSATLWRALDSLLDEEEYIQKHVVRRGLHVACAYSWERAARETFEVYCRTTGRPDLLPAEVRGTEDEVRSPPPEARAALEPGPTPIPPAREPDYHDPSGLSDLM